MATERTVLVRLKGNASDLVRAAAQGKAAIKSLGDEIDTTNDRTAWLAQGILALAPAVTTLGAGAVPVLAGLTTQMTVGVVAAGTMALAFNGVGDALGALNEYQLNPTAENLAKLNETMGNIGPAGADFVEFLDSIGPKFTELSNTAREGMFPGITEGIESFMDLMPQMNRIVAEVSRGIGDVASSAGADLAGPEWEDFFTYLETDARPVLVNMSNTVGNFAQGIGEMIAAFGPMTADFSRGFEDMSRSFAEWADGLETSGSFQSFLDYVNEAGPMALDFLASLSNAFVEIVKAAAPVGDVMLPFLTKFLDVVAELAATPLGPIVLGFAALTSAWGRLNALAQLTGSGVMARATQGMRTNLSTAKMLTPSIGELGTAFYRMGQSVENQTTKTRLAMTQTAAFGKAIAPVAGQVGLLAFAMTDVDDKMGLTNTTSLALAGSLAGPWGLAIGAGVGALMDMTQAGDAAADSQRRLSSVVRSGGTDFAGMQDAMRQSQELADGYVESLGILGGAYEGMDLFFTGESQADTIADRAQKDQRYFNDLADSMSRVGMAMGETFTDDLGRNTVPTMAELTRIAERAAPAMEALGITADDLAKMDDAGLARVSRQIADWTRHADSAEGRTEGFAQAVTDLGNDAISTADSATALSAALEALLSPALNLEEATDNWRASLRELKKELDDKAGFTGPGAAAEENRRLTREYTNEAIERLGALANVSTTTERDMANAVRATREELIQSGIAAGFSRKEMERRANAMGLTPKLIRTVFEAAGITAADLKARELRETYRSLPKDVRTVLRTEGIPKSKAEVNELVERLNLTEKERRALVKLMDQATPGMNKILEKLGLIDRTNPTPTVQVLSADAQAKLEQVARTLANLDGDVAYTEVVTRYRTVRSSSDATPPRGAGADGMTIPGPRYPYMDRDLYLLAPGEEVISNRFGQADRHRDLLKAINANRLADGGTVGALLAATASPSVSVEAPSLSLSGARFVLEVPGMGQVMTRVVRHELAADRRFSERLNDRD